MEFRHLRCFLAVAEEPVVGRVSTAVQPLPVPLTPPIPGFCEQSRSIGGVALASD